MNLQRQCWCHLLGDNPGDMHGDANDDQYDYNDDDNDDDDKDEAGNDNRALYNFRF